MSKTQVNFRFPDNLISALKEKAESERTSITDLVVSFLEQRLGLAPEPTSINSEQLDSHVAERITEHIQPLENRIATLELALGKYAA